LDDDQREAELQRAASHIDRSAESGRDAAIATSRRLVSGASAAESLSIGQKVSEALTEVVRRCERRPKYVLAKGGVTSSDVATRGLQIRRAQVLGQILPGVPVWRCGQGSRFPGMPYFVFPGNVGDAESLVDLVGALRSFD
jgi:uncharacterized protein YgbK (DUF1537 family)